MNPEAAYRLGGTGYGPVRRKRVEQLLVTEVSPASEVHVRLIPHARAVLKLPRFGGVFVGFGDYVSVATASLAASYAIGER